MIANVEQAGRDLARAGAAAGAGRRHPRGGRRPVQPGQVALGGGHRAGRLLDEASTKFNEELLVSMVDLGANVLYVDAALFFNLMAGEPRRLRPRRT